MDFSVLFVIDFIVLLAIDDRKEFYFISNLSSQMYKINTLKKTKHVLFVKNDFISFTSCHFLRTCVDNLFFVT
jgi:hypothetical protein